MIANGWRRNNLLGKYDFAPNGDGPERSGPAARRVDSHAGAAAAPHDLRRSAASTPQTTAQRVEAVQTLAANV